MHHDRARHFDRHGLSHNTILRYHAVNQAGHNEFVRENEHLPCHSLSLNIAVYETAIFNIQTGTEIYMFLRNQEKSNFQAIETRKKNIRTQM